MNEYADELQTAIEGSQSDRSQIAHELERVLGNARGHDGLTVDRFRREGLLRQWAERHAVRNKLRRPTVSIGLTRFRGVVRDFATSGGGRDDSTYRNRAALATALLCRRDIADSDLGVRRDRFASWVLAEGLPSRPRGSKTPGLVKRRTVEVWESAALGDLADELAREWDERVQEEDATPDPMLYVITSSRYEVSLNADGVMTEEVVARTVLPGQRPLSALPVSHKYLRDPQRGVVTIPVTRRCEIDPGQVTQADDGRLSAQCSFDPPLVREVLGDLGHSFGYTVRIDSSVRSSPEVRHLARTAERGLTIEVQFTRPAVPRTVWWYGPLFLHDAPGRPTDTTRLHVSQGSAGWTFNGPLVADRAYGVAWYWPEGVA